MQRSLALAVGVALLVLARAPVRAFMARDPGGYTIEFFRWLDR